MGITDDRDIIVKIMSSMIDMERSKLEITKNSKEIDMAGLLIEISFKYRVSIPLILKNYKLVIEELRSVEGLN